MQDTIAAVFMNSADKEFDVPDVSTVTAQPEQAKSDSSSRKASELSERIGSVMEDRGLTELELAELLSERLDKHIQRSTLTSWRRGHTPRIGADMVLDALEKIAHEADTRPRFVPSDEIKTQIEQWLTVLNERQLIIAAEISRATLLSYKRGPKFVKYGRWSRIKDMVNSAIDALDKSKTDA